MHRVVTQPQAAPEPAEPTRLGGNSVAGFTLVEIMLSLAMLSFSLHTGDEANPRG